MIPSDPRVTEFVRESNRIAGVELDVSCSDPPQGHMAALSTMMLHAAQYPLLWLDDPVAWQAELRKPYRPLLSRDVANWQAVIESEQASAGIAFSHDVTPTLEDWDAFLARLNQRLDQMRPPIDDVPLADALGWALFELSRLQPFRRCNGRICRLLVNYIAVYYQQPLLIFRADEKAGYEVGCSSEARAKAYMAEKIRERARMVTGEIVDRAKQYGAADRYVSSTGAELVIERHALDDVRRRWLEQG